MTLVSSSISEGIAPAKRARKGRHLANDPMRSRMAFNVLKAIGDKSPHEIERLTKAKGRKGVCSATVAKWYLPRSKGGTLYPSSRTLEAVAVALGHEFKLAKKGD